MMDSRHPRIDPPAVRSRMALDHLRAAWDWARATHPAVQDFDKGRPSLREVAVSSTWVLRGDCPDGRALHAYVHDDQLQISIATPGPFAPIAHVALDLPARLGGHPKAA